MTWIPPECRNRPRSPAHEGQKWLKALRTSRVSSSHKRRFRSSVSASTTWAKSGLDEKYQRDFNILNPINQYQQANPLNPAFGSGAT